MERTYVMVKPDGVEKGLIGEVIKRIEQKGYKITALKMMKLDSKIVREHYAHLVEKPFFPRIEAFMTRGNVVAMIVEGFNAVAGIRQIVGATDSCQAMPGTIRADYSTFENGENIVHASDSAESAEIEIKIFFGE